MAVPRCVASDFGSSLLYASCSLIAAAAVGEENETPGTVSKSGSADKSDADAVGSKPGGCFGHEGVVNLEVVVNS